MAHILWFLWHTFRLRVQGMWQSSVLQSICSCCCAAKDGRNVCDAKASSATIYGQDGKKEGQGGMGEKERGRLTSIKVEKLQQLQTSLQRLHDTKSIINICKLCARHIW